MYKSLWLLCMVFTGSTVFAQDDLLNSLEDDIDNQINYTAYTFKSTHIINGHSIEQMRTNQLDFRINHRFGELNTGLYNLYGLDAAIVNFSLDYGITDNLTIGLRRGTYQKTVDGSVKLKLFRQSSGTRNFPVSISYYADLSGNTQEYSLPLNQRLAYTHQILIASKLNEKISLQLTPSFVHRNLVDYFEENDIFSVGFGGRYKFHRRIAFTWEYFYSPQIQDSKQYHNPIALGFDIETGGHVFQLFITNSQPMVEKGMLAETKGDFQNGGLYLGFNMSRVFAFGKKE